MLDDGIVLIDSVFVAGDSCFAEVEYGEVVADNFVVFSWSVVVNNETVVIVWVDVLVDIVLVEFIDIVCEVSFVSVELVGSVFVLYLVDDCVKRCVVDNIGSSVVVYMEEQPWFCVTISWYLLYQYKLFFTCS